MAKRLKLLVCTKGKHCKKRGAKEILCGLSEQLECQGLKSKISLKKSECLGKCSRGPAVQIMPEDQFCSISDKNVVENFVRKLKKKKKAPKEFLLRR